MRMPEIQYPLLVPVETDVPEWIKTVTYYSEEDFGKADWIAGQSADIPLANVKRSKFEVPVHMAGIGYQYSLEEVQQAQMLGMNLPGDEARAARRAYELMVEEVAFRGDTTKNFFGLYNYPGVTAAAATNGAWLGGVTTPAEMIQDVNDLLTAVSTDTNFTIAANTLLLPHSRFQHIAGLRIDSSNTTVLEFITQKNVYTATTGQALRIRGTYGLETAGALGVARMVAYVRSPDVLSMFIPMRHQFLPVQQQMLTYTVPGIFRLGGLDIRRPKEVQYADGI
jgi:hypothetical protein